MPPKKAEAAKPEAKPAAATPPPSQVLPSKEAALFRQILRYYETKQYKKGIKTADTILAKFPLHGETIAMKGLTYNCMNKKEEARTLVKKGLALNIKSHVCWHVYGLLYRSERAYNDAIKCYQNAIRIDPTNNEILKDLSLLQIQRRMTEGFAETRRKILMLKTNNRNNWIALALGHHLSGKFKQAVGVIDAFNKTIDAKSRETKTYEHSEMLLYKNMILEESGDLEGALKHLNEIKPEVMDELHWLERSAALNLALKHSDVAEKEYRALLKINSENYNYHNGLASALGITSSPSSPRAASEDDEKKLVSLYEQLKVEYPDNAAVDRLPLNFLQGAAFEKAVSNYFIRAVRKGIPSLFRDFKSLYADSNKIRVISDLLKSVVEQLKSSRRFTADAAVDSESPSAYVWALYYQVQHLDFLGKHDEALTVVEELIAHTPTNLDAFMLKARLLKHVGEPQLAHTYMDQARRMDTADRYLNTKCTRYALRADNLPVAETTVSLFLRDGDTLASLADMQCSWYENESGELLLRQGEFGKALKQFVSVTKHFQDMEEDQFDFHSYCLRKMTLRAYVKMMRMEDNLKSHRFFVRAVKGIVTTYLRIYDARQQPAKKTDAEETDPQAAKAAEKKAKREAAKAAKKQAEAAAEAEKQRQEEASKKPKEEGRKKKEDDPDPDGAALVAKDPLVEASTWAKELLLYSYDNVEAHLLAGEVFSRSKRYLLWLRSLKQVHALSPQLAESIDQRVRFLHAMETAEVHETIRKVVDLERSWLGPSAKAVLEATESKELSSAFVLAKGRGLIDSSAKAAALKTLSAFDVSKDPTATIPLATRVLDYLEQEATEEDAKAFKARCAVKFNRSPRFMAADDVTTFHTANAFQDPLTADYSVP